MIYHRPLSILSLDKKVIAPTEAVNGMQSWDLSGNTIQKLVVPKIPLSAFQNSV